jgi:hypothetical protein
MFLVLFLLFTLCAEKAVNKSRYSSVLSERSGRTTEEARTQDSDRYFISYIIPLTSSCHHLETRW